MQLNELTSISIDVDGIGCYHSIHGLEIEGDDPIYTKALPRFLDAMDELGCRATLFVIGKDLECPPRQQLIAEAAARGHEIASHSYAHDYGLSRAAPASIDADLCRAADLIKETSGRRPRGFRAPGYNQSEALFDALERQKIAYDSSFFPTPAYFAARAAALLKYRLTRRESQSLLGDFREFSTTRNPFMPSATKRFRPASKTQGERVGSNTRSFVEIPMTVSTPMRLPWLGTTLALFPDAIGVAMTHAVLFRAHPVVLELHAMEFLGANDGVSKKLIGLQPDLQVPLDDKLRRLRRTFDLLSSKRTVVPLEEIAQAALVHDDSGVHGG
ncbi:MAG: polysaccharide deacetylase family protein [Deltaproteobacteria bacterium]|nr:polysaccharide deacetylase family protein [Deltaproteobacteria bacterium]